MKRDSERKKFYSAKLHTRKNLMHVHTSKELRNKLNIKTRALLANKGDSVKIMRGIHRNKTSKIAKISYVKRLVYLEGISRKNAKGTEKLIPFQPSNLMLIELNMTKDRKKKFGEQTTTVDDGEAPKI
ncbi:MAG: 50S ribosomal protein L24 [Candidatus Micrarchaeota archaeon]